MSRRSRRVRYFTPIDGPILGAPLLSHERLAYHQPINAGDRLVITDTLQTRRRHEVEIIDPVALTVRWIADAGELTYRSAGSTPCGPKIQ